jgi:twitching motility protein PilT
MVGALLAERPAERRLMRVIETLLGIVDMKRADGLLLVLGEVPALLMGGGHLPLTMPALSAEMMEHVLADSFSDDDRAALRETGMMEAVYQSASCGTYAVHARMAGAKLTLTLRRIVRGAARAAQASRGVEPAPASLAPYVPPPAPAEVSSSARVGAPPDERPPARLFDALFEEAIARRASDVIVSAGRPPLLRVDGVLVECSGSGAAPGAALDGYLNELLGPQQKRTFEVTGSVDLSFGYVDARGERLRFRANAFRHEAGVALVLRLIGAAVPTLAELRLPPSLVHLVEHRTGLVLFTGPTGSGKSTTLAALLEHLNRTRAAHIVTLEEPIEHVYRSHRSIIHQREVGEHVESFASGLRAALRENPDVLLVGEMRDPETIRMALTAAQTGHLVLSTLHSGHSVMAIERILDAFPEGEQSHVRQELAVSLRHVVAQRLVPATGGGRLPVLEILTVNHAVAAQIRDGRTHMVATQLETGAEDGMVPMARSLASLVRSGEITRSVAMAACDHRDTLEKLLEERAGVRATRT